MTRKYLADYVSIFIFNFSHNVENSGLTWEICTLIINTRIDIINFASVITIILFGTKNVVS